MSSALPRSKRRDRSGSVTKLADGRFWARGPRQENGRRESIGYGWTREEAEALLKPKPVVAPGTWASGPPLKAPYDWWDPVETNSHWRAKERKDAADRACHPPASLAVFDAWRVQHEREYRLERHLDGWRRAQEIRAYITELLRLLDEFGCTPPRGAESELTTWIAWCEEHANRLDPMSMFRKHLARTAALDRQARARADDGRGSGS